MTATSSLLSVDELVRQMGHYLATGEGAYFLGSGASVPSGLPDFYNLMKDVAESLGIALRSDDDFPQIAQYAVNADNGNRAPLFGRLQRALRDRSRRAINPYHECIAKTNVSTIWTTNFDTLLESRLAGR
jgi:NAD-dependent SIR2 family protein deacetylase